MLHALSRGIISIALTLMGVATAWLVIDILFADPAVLIFEDLAILCAVLAPILYLVGWALLWFDGRSGAAAG